MNYLERGPVGVCQVLISPSHQRQEGHLELKASGRQLVLVAYPSAFLAIGLSVYETGVDQRRESFTQHLPRDTPVIVDVFEAVNPEK